MVKKLDFKYWSGLKAPPAEADAVAINDAFHSDGKFTEQQKEDLARLILTSRVRIPDETRAAALNEAIGIFNRDFAVEEFFYSESVQVFCTWRYDYTVFAHALPAAWAKRGIRRVYAQLGVELDDEEVMKIYNSDCIYSAFLELISDTLGNFRYFVTNDKEAWHSFAFVSYFNMWKLFGLLGFNGYSPYVICADIGLLTPSASQWRHAALSEEDLCTIEELKARARGRSYPTWQQNRFMAKLAKI